MSAVGRQFSWQPHACMHADRFWGSWKRSFSWLADADANIRNEPQIEIYQQPQLTTSLHHYITASRHDNDLKFSTSETLETEEKGGKHKKK